MSSMPSESPQNTTDTEDLQLPNELVYELVRKMDRHETANHLAIYVLRRWKCSTPKIVTRPPDGYLEPICSVPIDIFYEILEHLHPIDLYHLSQANRAFRTLLRHPSSSSAWNLAFENNPGVPRCPPETPAFPTKMSGFEWAGMLFGKHICQICGEGNAPPNITFRHFRCANCAFVHDRLVDLVHQVSKYSVAYTLVRKGVVLQLSQKGDFLNFSKQWYKHSEVEVNTVYNALTRYEDAILSEKPGAREVYDAYMAKRRAEINPINEHSALCLQWAEELRKCYLKDLERRNLNIMKKIRSRFRRLGHHPEDIEKATIEIAFPTNMSRLSKKRWETIKPLLEPAITRAKNDRQTRQRGILIKKRKELVHELYREYKKSVPPLTWAYLPPHYAIYRFKPFADLINELHDNELDREHCEDALHCLPKEIEDWTVAKRRHLLSLLPRDSGSDATTSPPQPDAGPSSSSGTFHLPEADFNALQLATSVFCCPSNVGFCKTGVCLIGWDTAAPHLRCSLMDTFWESQLYFSQRGHEAATALVDLAYLEPGAANTNDMDQLDYRYICTSCPVGSGLKRRTAYNWREAVLHYIKKSHDIEAPHHTPTWSLLTPEAEAHIKRREGPDPYTYEHSWSCALCPEHFKNMAPRDEAMEHVKSEHNVSTPVEGTDFFYLITGEERTRPRRVGFAECPPSEYTCTHCVSRLRNMEAMLRHLHPSHQIEEPVAGRDWVRVQTILRSVPLVSPMPE